MKYRKNFRYFHKIVCITNSRSKLKCNDNNRNFNYNNNDNNNASLCKIANFYSFIKIFGMFISENLLIKAYKKARRWKQTHSREIQKRIENEWEYLKILYDELISDKYRIWQPARYIIQDPVMREIICLPFRDRIVQHLVHEALYPLIEKHAIHDVYSNMVWKWNLYGVKRISRFLRSGSNNFTKDCRILKLDIQTFFLNINKEILWQKILKLINKRCRTSNRYDWPWITKIIHQIIFYDYRKYLDFSSSKLDELFPYHKSMKSTDWTYWLPLGNLTSQLFANIYLHELDHFVKHKLKVKYYGTDMWMTLFWFTKIKNTWNDVKKPLKIFSKKD